MDLATIIAKLEELALPQRHWVVHGSGPLVLHGLTPAVNDLDIIVRGPAWQAALRVGEPVAGKQDLVVRYGDDVELWSGWLGDDVDELIDSAELVSGVPVVPLAVVLRFKERLARPKDAAHIALLRSHLGPADAAATVRGDDGEDGDPGTETAAETAAVTDVDTL